MADEGVLFYFIDTLPRIVCLVHVLMHDYFVEGVYSITAHRYTSLVLLPFAVVKEVGQNSKLMLSFTTRLEPAHGEMMLDVTNF